VGSLPLVLIWLLALGLLLLYSQQALVGEQRSAAQQVRTAQAAEAAEAGMAWLLTQLQREGSIDDQCLPYSAPSSVVGAPPPPASLKGRLLQAMPTSAACVHTGTDWRCHCPAQGLARLSLPTGEARADQPAFAVRLSPAPAGRTGARAWQADATGCNHLAAPCGGSGTADALQQQHLRLGALGSLIQAPAATLTALGAVTLGDGVGLAQPDGQRGGWSVQAGGRVTTSAGTRLQGPPGRPGGDTLQAAAPWLDSGQPDIAFWQPHFGSTAAALQALPQFTRIDCAAGCTSAALDAQVASGRRLLWAAGALTLTSGLRWGSADAPLLLVVEGPLTGAGGIQIDGLIVAGQLRWNATGAAALVRGALVSLGDATLAGPLQVVHDRARLETLASLSGTWAPIPGSWQDVDHRPP
jgi:hypothetical protein